MYKKYKKRNSQLPEIFGIIYRILTSFLKAVFLEAAPKLFSSEHLDDFITGSGLYDQNDLVALV